MVELATDPEAWVSLLVLTLMEVVLGIDNIVFIAILTAKLPASQRTLARRLGLTGALVTRVLLLLVINFLAHLEEPWFTFFRPWSGKDLVLVSGGVFLLWKATREIYQSVERPEAHGENVVMSSAAGIAKIVVQITLLDIVFSLDSVITAVGMADHVEVMIAAISIAIVVMMVFARPIGDFVQNNPSVKVLALAFLVLIGATLVMEGTGQHIAKGYVYSAMGFSLAVQVLNLRMARRNPSDAHGNESGSSSTTSTSNAPPSTGT